MSYLQAILLGILQGLTEFLPVSSSGHLVLFPWLLGWQLDPQVKFAFDILVQVGTILAVILYFWRDLLLITWETLTALTQGKPFATSNARLGWWILLGTIPAGFFGLLLKDFFEQFFSSPFFVILFLFITAALLFTAEFLFRRQATPRSLEELTWPDALVVGFAQVLAILPGVSRSGSTITAGLVRGLNRNSAARYSFLLSIPIMLAAGLIGSLDLLALPNFSNVLTPILLGMFVSAVVGFAAIHWFLGFLRTRSLIPFAIYCIGFASLCLVIWVVRGIFFQPLNSLGVGQSPSESANSSLSPSSGNAETPLQEGTPAWVAPFRIAVTSDTEAKTREWNQFVAQDFRAEVVSYPTHSQAIQALQSGEVQAVMAYEVVDGFSAWQITSVRLAIISPTQNAGVNFDYKLWLSQDQLRRLFGGEITNWNELGLGDMPVQVLVRDADSAMGRAFSRQVLQGQALGGGAVLRPSEPAVLQGVAAQPGSLGYVVWEDLTSSVQPVVIEGLLPDSPDYPWHIPVLVLTSDEPQGALRQWIATLQKAVD
ncbi:MAG TPA: undecaprenyl-diphosphatase UppP [Anaerolineales bacterium]|nr:undecaprenyl-diphosphatase UppP [Anaerolineales bacterium]